MAILPQELSTLDRLLRLHPRSNSFRLSSHDDVIEVFERATPNLAYMLATFGIASDELGTPAETSISMVLRFVLEDEERRVFRAERAMANDEWEIVERGRVSAIARDSVASIT